MAVAIAEIPMTVAPLRSPRPRRTFEQAGIYVDSRYAFLPDGYRIVEKATGRVFHRDLWTNRGL